MRRTFPRSPRTLDSNALLRRFWPEEPRACVRDLPPIWPHHQRRAAPCREPRPVRLFVGRWRAADELDAVEHDVEGLVGGHDLERRMLAERALLLLAEIPLEMFGRAVAKRADADDYATDALRVLLLSNIECLTKESSHERCFMHAAFPSC